MSQELYTAYGYCRHTIPKPVEEQTDKLLLEYYIGTLQKRGLFWGSVFQDGGEEASKQNWYERPAGRELFNRVKSGDHVVVESLSRPFISIDDAVASVNLLKSRGVTLHVLGFPRVDLLETLQYWQKFMSDLGYDKRKYASPHTGFKGVVKVGYRLSKDKKTLLVDEHDRACCVLAVNMLKGVKMTLDELVALFRARGLRTSKNKLWQRARLYNGMKLSKAELWNTPPAALPDKPTKENDDAK